MNHSSLAHPHIPRFDRCFLTTHYLVIAVESTTSDLGPYQYAM